MKVVRTISELRRVLTGWRQAGDRISLVPTMGNLHAGHLQLVTMAQQQAERVVVSIFVNPTQFGQGEDFESYPRTEAEDIEKLKESGVALAFIPSLAEMYPGAQQVSLHVTGLAERWCGASRPGHFDGVATIVAKLFNLIQPDSAVFGEKDYQQLAVIRQMVRDLNIPVSIVGAPIVREPDGLAMSSRNSYLTPEQRAIAPRLYQALCQMRDAIQRQEADTEAILQAQQTHLQQAGFKLDYLALCNAETLEPAHPDDQDLVILVAAWLGKPRLIDNLRFSRFSGNKTKTGCRC
ncbi:pantoate--beta-alanine ligase [methane-oxidizing endosymbiont of Gigantopelta aegis]|uniref:pantoate--beta-alanine ligase n=1 Tax=methane-oxidizing endosymbiont of Gigantopelta aegis TaxID=2794938 RepID=UPI0018DB55AE|nr:pantoate--beta-alanine ligase [methane-oxidizing endosymbiont of Gigantopelta aegis]